MYAAARTLRPLGGAGVAMALATLTACTDFNDLTVPPEAGSPDARGSDAFAAEDGTPDTCTGAHLHFDPATGHCYRFTPVLVEWSAAQSDCQEWGGHLVAIGSGDEFGVVSEIENSELAPDASPQQIWIGLERSDGGLVWSDGEKVGFVNWGSNEPSTRDCGIQYTQRYGNHWALFQCIVLSPYLCERP